MSGFSTKQNNTQVTNNTNSTVTDEEWGVWNEYYWGLIDSKETPAKRKSGEVVPNKFVKKTNEVGLLKMIVDCGTQPQPDSEYDSKVEAPEKGSEGLSHEEEVHIQKFTDNYFFWGEDGKRKQGKPERPTQEYVFFYDFPNIMVDWTKHPIEGLHRLGEKPLRVSVNGSFSRDGKVLLGRHLRLEPHFKTNKLSPNNPIFKIAEKSRLGSEFEVSGYDLGVLVDSACKWDLILEKNISNDRMFFNTVIKDPAEITEVKAGNITVTVEQQIPECPTTFMGILMNGGDYPDEALEIISHRRELMTTLPLSKQFQPNAKKFPDFWLGVDWKSSDLCKALEAYTGSQTNSEEPKEEAKQPQGEVNKHPVKEPTVQVTQHKEPPMDFDDDIPF
jgi:hypothetical protein